MISIKINKKKYKVKEGARIIDICREHGIEIASLCDHPDFGEIGDKVGLKDKEENKLDQAVCRLCMVKVRLKGTKEFQLVPSCQLAALVDMEVITEDAEIGRLRKTNLELLFADHAGLCPHCKRNQDCELQDLALKYDIDAYRFAPGLNDLSDEQELELLQDKLAQWETDNVNPCIERDSEKCIKCRRCIKICRDFQTVGSYDVSKSGNEVKIGTEFNTPLECTYCGQCTAYCPTAALTEKNDIGSFIKALNDENKTVVVQTAPSIRVALGEEFGLLPGTVVTEKMVSALKEAGADLVFDTNLTADLTIMEESAELIRRIKDKEKPLPMFTSCCPAWILFVERYYPNLIPHLSSCRSPQMMMGSLIKYYWGKNNKIDPKQIYSVSVMPCLAKKYEIKRPEYQNGDIPDVDCVISTRELGRFLKLKGLNLMDLPDKEFDSALGLGTGAAAIFGVTGGVMEAALRTAHYMLTGKEAPAIEFKQVRGERAIRMGEIKIGKLNLRVKVVHGLGNARRVLEQMKRGEIDFDFLEVMACPNGCIGGGGQPIPNNAKIRKARAKAIYNTDRRKELRRSHENPLIQEIYKDFLKEPGSKKSEKYLHTEYYPYQFKWRK